mmetsp:Transcript_23479/g.38590  ORF Transcript_23479/g.38590 Transcript_23479/m.38590 type:complete len:390 (-) Transcript_23479:371-1540(-)|eukprot:CAMPEP_0184648744 /NCGR_PEP_ID=MMETSP0308-20130426/5928_1 /TAXON_ID=38269 /ORGANISM="Gloeochaete witrockiana, Strain SAG 46.84" /LENGTH=389 /DNA_ID=CAMNT_0027080843 /DNA_START=108 /DNA_END=1277 /DNA_ORIENTATION=-
MAEEDACLLGDLGEYDRPLHIAAVFIILATSGLAALIPVLLSHAKKLKVPTLFFEICRAFGAGVILATAFIHMIPPAIENLTNPCLGHVWTEEYSAFATLFVMAAILGMHAIEFIADAYVFRHAHDSDPLQVLATPQSSKMAWRKTIVVSKDAHDDHDHHGEHSHEGHSHDHDDHSHQPDAKREILTETLRDGEIKKAAESESVALPSAHKDLTGHDHVHAIGLSLDRGRLRVSTIILELGIAMHSVIIGITLGAATAPEFNTLLIALVFHQTFEGLALGSVIVEAAYSSQLTSLIAVALYAMATPIGVAVGIGIYESFNPNSTTALLTTGILDAISGGILVYNAFVHLLVPTFLSNDGLLKAKNYIKLLHFGALYLGAGIMAYIGRYA